MASVLICGAQCRGGEEDTEQVALGLPSSSEVAGGQEGEDRDAGNR